MYRMACFSILVLLVFSLGCNSGGGLIVWDIEGPTSIEVNDMAYYHVNVGPATGLKYDWAVDPPNAGIFIPGHPLAQSGGWGFTGGNSGRATFATSRVPIDGPVIIRVVVSSNEYAPVLRELVVKIVGYQNF